MDITPCTPGDAAILAHLHIEGWRSSYGGLVKPDFLAELDKGAREKDWVQWLGQGTTALLARDTDGAPAGFIAFNKLMTPPPGMSPVRPLYTAEILALYILPDYWRRGLGRQLMGRAVETLRANKHKSICLWVLEKNMRGVAFYKALGGERCGKKKVEIGDQHFTDICFGWRESSILIPTS